MIKILKNVTTTLVMSLVALQDSSNKILHNNHIYILNIVVACFLTCQLLRSLLWLSYVVLRTWQLKRVWKRRRAMSVTIFFIEVIAQMVRPASKKHFSLVLHRRDTGITTALRAASCIPSSGTRRGFLLDARCCDMSCTNIVIPKKGLHCRCS